MLQPRTLFLIIALHALVLYTLQLGLKSSKLRIPAREEVSITLLAPVIGATKPATRITPILPKPVLQIHRSKHQQEQMHTSMQAQKDISIASTPVEPVNSKPASNSSTTEKAQSKAVESHVLTTNAESVPSITAPRFDAAYLNNPAPEYPPASRRAGEVGKVILRVFVKTDGHAGEVVLRTSSGYTRLDEAAIAAVRNWRFVSATQGAQAIAAWVLVPVSFTLNY